MPKWLKQNRRQWWKLAFLNTCTYIQWYEKWTFLKIETNFHVQFISDSTIILFLTLGVFQSNGIHRPRSCHWKTTHRNEIRMFLHPRSHTTYCCLHRNLFITLINTKIMFDSQNFDVAISLCCFNVQHGMHIRLRIFATPHIANKMCSNKQFLKICVHGGRCHNMAQLVEFRGLWCCYAILDYYCSDFICIC